MAERKSISKKVRFDIFKRDQFTCQYCGATPPGSILHVDHIEAVANGGGNHPDNLVTSCEACNLGKGARALDVVPQSLSAKALEVAEREEQLRGYQEILEARRQRIEDEVWRVMALLYPGEKSVPRESFNSTRMFIEKLGVYAVIESAEIALGARCSVYKLFRYFCGVCWNKVREAGNGSN